MNTAVYTMQKRRRAPIIVAVDRAAKATRRRRMIAGVTKVAQALLLGAFMATGFITILLFGEAFK